MKKKCFIITPIGEEGSLTRDKADGVIESMSPILEELGFIPNASHWIDIPGSITKQIIESILNDDLVIANLTDLNPNVMYELAVRHATAKPVITIAEYETRLPFDITTERTIFYTNDMKGVPKFKNKLRDTINSINFEQAYRDNPIYRAMRDFKFKETVTEGKDEYIIEQLEELKNMQQNISGLFKYFNTFERPGLRLIKACKDFNVSLKDIVDYLETKDIIIESNPNYKITPDIYNIIKDRFGFKNKNSQTP